MTAERPDAGFLLVETIVAFLILSIALGIGVQSVAQGTAVLRRADDAAAATLVARELFATRATELTGPGDWSGRHASGAAWRLVAAPIGDGGPLPLYSVAVQVRPQQGGPVYDFRSFAVGAPPQ